MTFDRLDVLKKECIRFTQPEGLNDLWELKPHVGSWLLQAAPTSTQANVPPEEAELYEEHLLAVNRKYNQIHGDPIRQELAQTWGVLSLTESNKNDLMWPHYASDHRGFVLEFDTSHEFFQRDRTDEELLCGPIQVSYTKTRPTFGFAPNNQPTTVEGWRQLLCLKSESWSYEQEWRMLALLEKGIISKTKMTKEGHLLFLFIFLIYPRRASLESSSARE